MFDALQCDREFAEEFIGTGITDSNLEQYLGLIEQRASEILQAYALIQSKKGRSDFVLPGPRDPPSTNQIRIEAPNVRDDISEEEEDEVDDDKPLTTEEFKQRAEKRAQSMRLQQRKFKTKTRAKK